MNDRINEICEMYGNNEARIIAAAEALGCKTDSWYVAAQHIEQESATYAVKLIEVNGNPFPNFNGEALSWSIGLYDTINEQNSGYKRLMCVVRAMKAHRPEQLKEEIRLLKRASLDRVFGQNAKRQLRAVESALQ